MTVEFIWCSAAAERDNASSASATPCHREPPSQPTSESGHRARLELCIPLVLEEPPADTAVPVNHRCIPEVVPGLGGHWCHACTLPVPLGAPLGLFRCGAALSLAEASVPVSSTREVVPKPGSSRSPRTPLGTPQRVFTARAYVFEVGRFPSVVLRSPC